MTTFKVPTREEVSSGNQAIFDKLKSAVGMVPNLYAAMAQSETALDNYLKFQNAPTSFSKKEKEVINLVTSQENQCDYCISAHTVIGGMNGFSKEQILDLRAGVAPWNSKTDALVKLTKAIVETRGKNVSKELEAFYAAGYNEGSLSDLVLAVADKVVMNYLHNITQVEIDYPLAEKLEIAKA